MVKMPYHLEVPDIKKKFLELPAWATVVFVHFISFTIHKLIKHTHTHTHTLSLSLVYTHTFSLSRMHTHSFYALYDHE